MDENRKRIEPRSYLMCSFDGTGIASSMVKLKDSLVTNTGEYSIVDEILYIDLVIEKSKS